MTETEEGLLAVVENLIRINRECASAVVSACGLPDVTVRQAAYLRLIDEQGEVTFGRLAEATGTSRPTVTEMIDRCARMACVYRERSPDDGRIHYIRLTEKGRTIARAERVALLRTLERLMAALDDREQATLIQLLGKIR